MDTYDNPAGRLHLLLSELREAGPNRSLVSAWAQVLKVTEADLVLSLGNVAQLIPDLQSAVEAVGDDAYVRTVDRYRGTWTNAIFPTDAPLGAPLKQVALPAPESMEALAVVSSHLHREAPEGRIPSDDKIGELYAQITSLLDEVRDSDLPDELKHLVLRRLQDILNALGHLSVKGPAAVRSAIEALVGSVAMTHASTTEPSVWAKPAWRKLVTTIVAAYAVFSAGPSIQASLEAWPRVEQMVLGPSSDESGMSPRKADDASSAIGDNQHGARGNPLEESP